MHGDFRGQLIDIFKGCISVLVVTIVISGAQYIGAHVPDILNVLGKLAGAVAGVKFAKD